MAAVSQVIRKSENLFEKKFRQALAHVKNGSITVIKQDNLVIQVNICESLDWSYASNTQQSV